MITKSLKSINGTFELDLKGYFDLQIGLLREDGVCARMVLWEMSGIVGRKWMLEVEECMDKWKE